MSRATCPVEASLPRFVDNDLSPEDSARISDHLQQCQVCRAHAHALNRLVADLRAPLLQELDVEAHARAILAALDGAGHRPARPRPSRGALGAAAWVLLASAAVVPLGYLAMRAPVQTAGLQARGGGHTRPSIARDVGVQLYIGRERLEPLHPGAALVAECAITAGYRNLGEATVSLLLFALDAGGTVHWISPRFSDPREDPVATLLPHTQREQLLPTTVVFDEPAPGRMRVFTVLSATPTHVSDIESLVASAHALSASDITRRLPHAEVRETTVLLLASNKARP